MNQKEISTFDKERQEQIKLGVAVGTFSLIKFIFYGVTGYGIAKLMAKGITTAVDKIPGKRKK
jgi:hypothetical protein